MSEVTYQEIATNLTAVLEEILEDMGIGDITITKQTTPTTGSLATYVLKKDDTNLTPKIEIAPCFEVVSDLSQVSSPSENKIYIVLEA